MKQFIQKVGFYLFIVALILTGNFIFNSYQVEHAPMLPEARTVVIGDSRMMTGVDPQRLENSRNYAANSESYFISYYKLRYILNHSKGIKQIVLGFSYPSLSAYMDGIFQNDMATADVLDRVYPIISLDDFGAIPVDKEKYRIACFRNLFVYPHTNHTPFLGGFESLPEGINKETIPLIIRRHYFINDSVNCGTSQINRNYLDSIQKLTEANGIHLIFVNLPVHKEYRDQIPENFVQFFEQTKREMESKSMVYVLDFGANSCEDELFKDAVHLSNKGAEFYTQKIREALEKLDERE